MDVRPVIGLALLAGINVMACQGSTAPDAASGVRASAALPPGLQLSWQWARQGATASAQGRAQEADRLFEHAVTMTVQVLGADHAWLIQVLLLAGRHHLDYGRWELADLLLTRAVLIADQCLAFGHPLRAASLWALARLRSRQGDLAFSNYLSLRAFWHSGDGLVKSSSARFAARWSLHLGQSSPGADANSDLATTEQLALAKLRERTSRLGLHHPDLAHSMIALARIYAAQGLPQRTTSLYRHALTILLANWQPEHPAVRALVDEYAAFLEGRGQRRSARRLRERVDCHIRAR